MPALAGALPTLRSCPATLNSMDRLCYVPSDPASLASVANAQSSVRACFKVLAQEADPVVSFSMIDAGYRNKTSRIRG